MFNEINIDIDDLENIPKGGRPMKKWQSAADPILPQLSTVGNNIIGIMEESDEDMDDRPPVSEADRKR